MLNDITNSIIFNDTLLSSSKNLIALNVDLFISLIQKHILKNGFIIIKKRFKMNKRAKVHKIWLRCTRENKIYENVDQKRKHKIFRLNNYLFNYILKLDKKEITWRLYIKNAFYNYDLEKRVTHLIHRKAALISQIKETIVM